MPRNKTIHPWFHELIGDGKHLELQHDHVTGPISFLNPTHALFRHSPSPPASEDTDHMRKTKEDSPQYDKEQAASNIQFKWRSRDNRKGRHALVVDQYADPSAKHLVPPKTSDVRAVLRGVGRMFTQYPYWDVSWLVAVIFTLGSVIWVINAFFAFLPLVQPGTAFHNEVLVGGGVTAFVGATIFEVGSLLLMIEAMNENRSGCFGWALERVFNDNVERDTIRILPDHGKCSHHHTNKKNFVGKGFVEETLPTSQSDSSDTKTKKKENLAGGKATDRPFVWWPSMHELKTHYLRELGFLASFSQLCGATIFWISGFTALPGINNKMSQGLLDGIFWVPQIVGGTGFIISGSLFMLETQPKWYVPAWEVLGWHIGFWNLIGAFGFTLCGALGPAHGNSGAEYESSLATFWGSWAFLVGSLIQW
ncbi:hypothetical protein ACLMJK_003158 [Lecanora helva]